MNSTRSMTFLTVFVATSVFSRVSHAQPVPTETPATADKPTVTDKSIQTDSSLPSPEPPTVQKPATPGELPATFTSRLRAAKTAEIRRKLDRLKKLLEASAMALEKAETRINTPGPADSAPTEVGSGSPTSVVPANPDQPSGTAKVTPVTVPDSTAPDSTAPDSQTDKPRVIMTSPVNRLRLADSLFGAGKTDPALQAYESLELDRLEQIDQIWVQFQIASCHRRLGAIAKAEQHYRIVASYKTVDVAVEAARWWLDRLHARHELTDKSKILSKSVDSLEAPGDAE